MRKIKKYWLSLGFKGNRILSVPRWIYYRINIWKTLYKPNAKLPLAKHSKTYTEIKSIYDFHVTVG